MEIKEKKLAKNTIIILVSKIFTQFLSILLLPLLTAVLSTHDYGSFDLITTYAWFITGFMSLQIENGIFRFIIDSRGKKDEISTIITSGMFSILISAIIFSCIYLPIFYLLDVKYYFLIYLYAISTILLNVPLQISRGLGDNVTYAVASIMTGIINISMSFITLYVFHLGIKGLVISIVLANVVGCVFIFIRKKFYLYIKRKARNKNMSLKILKYSLPLFPNSISSWIMNISDKIMISYYINNSATGLYSVATKFPLLLSHLYSVFNLSWSEAASVNVTDADRNLFFSKSINRMFIICSSICLIVMASMPIIFSIMIDIKFSISYNYVPILILASIFELFTILLGGVYISFKLSKNIALTTTIASAFNVLINFIFLRKYGIVVACISTLVSYVILAIIRYINIRKYIKLKLNIKYYLIIILTYLVILPLYYWKNSFISTILMLLITIIITIILNRAIIKQINNKILKNIKK